ncbi:MAG TPA: ATP-binding cassette domain-containing protein [Candidatus Sulfotelmatobacter sp.]|nr:ATP-binding cassette domain-containing protein [Candidatus Sulfotelmatobacter sp.]
MESGAEEFRLEVRNLAKRFGSVVALEDVSFGVRPGEVVGLVGDNGAGKSTAIKIICGVHRPSAGHIYWEGREASFDSPQQARALGIQTVYQDLALVNTLSIARNFFLHAEPRFRVGPLRFLDVRAMNARTAQILRDIGIRDLNPTTPVSALSGGERQAVAIGRTYYFGGKLLILDEPTSALSVKQTQKVFSIIQEVRAKGVSVILIEHNMIHVHEIADRLVVMRHGKVFGDYRKSEVGIADLERILAGVR